MKRRACVVGLAAIPIALVMSAVGNVTAHAQKKDTYVLHYAVLIARPKGVNPYPPGESSPVLRQLQDGTDLPLKGYPEAALAALRKDEPNLEFVAMLSGSRRVRANNSVTVEAGPSQRDPYRLTFKGEFTIEPKPDGTTDLPQWGSFSWVDSNSTPTSQSTSGTEWKGVRKGLKLGHTYAGGIIGLEGRSKQLFHIYSVSQ